LALSAESSRALVRALVRALLIALSLTPLPRPAAAAAR
jgi:hypothetical protein